MMYLDAHSSTLRQPELSSPEVVPLELSPEAQLELYFHDWQPDRFSDLKTAAADWPDGTTKDAVLRATSHGELAALFDRLPCPAVLDAKEALRRVLDLIPAPTNRRKAFLDAAHKFSDINDLANFFAALSASLQVEFEEAFEERLLELHLAGLQYCDLVRLFYALPRTEHSQERSQARAALFSRALNATKQAQELFTSLPNGLRSEFSPTYRLHQSVHPLT